MTFEELFEDKRITPVGIMFYDDDLRLIYKYDNSTDVFIYIDEEDIGLYVDGIKDTAGKMTNVDSANNIIAYVNEHAEAGIVGTISLDGGYITLCYVDGDTYTWENTVTGEKGETNLSFEVPFEDFV